MSLPLAGDKLTAWSNLSMAIVPRFGLGTAAPMFFGGQPLEELAGSQAGFTVLSHEGQRGLDLVESLHVHTIMRDPQNDYGTDWLANHAEAHAWTPRR